MSQEFTLVEVGGEADAAALKALSSLVKSIVNEMQSTRRVETLEIEMAALVSENRRLRSQLGQISELGQEFIKEPGNVNFRKLEKILTVSQLLLSSAILLCLFK